jgi:putative hemolysin
MNSITLQVLLIILLTLANGVLAMSEIAIVYSRKARLRQYAASGDGRAQAALDLADAPTRLLSTVQIGITMVGILAGALGGATIAAPLAALLREAALLAPYADIMALVVVVGLITYLSLVVGELVPKRLALNNAEKIAMAVARPLRWLSALSAPAVRLLGVSTDAVLRLLGMRQSKEPPITQEEVGYLLDEGTQAGVFERAERDIMRRVLRLADRRISNVMTHRTEIVWLDLDDDPREIAKRIVQSAHSIYPVARGSLDNILGVAQARDLLAQHLTGQRLDVQAILRSPLFVPESADLLDALERFREMPLPIALVVDEHGGLEGLLTISDVLQAIIGDIPQTDHEEEPEAIQRPDGSWLLDGALPIDEVRELVKLRTLPGEAEKHFETLGGFVMDFLGRIPATADHFQWGGLSFEVMDMDGLRVDKVLVVPAAGGAAAREGPAREESADTAVSGPVTRPE